MSDFCPLPINLKRQGGLKMEEYLTVQELGERIKFSKQSIYNLIYKKKFILGVHYLKPTLKKILFVWSEVEKWLRQSVDEPSESVAPNRPHQTELAPQQSNNNYTSNGPNLEEIHPVSAIRI
jgi:predicted DNA-binding transcriptional regulator AlpA